MTTGVEGAERLENPLKPLIKNDLMKDIKKAESCLLRHGRHHDRIEKMNGRGSGNECLNCSRKQPERWICRPTGTGSAGMIQGLRDRERVIAGGEAMLSSPTGLLLEGPYAEIQIQSGEETVRKDEYDRHANLFPRSSDSLVLSDECRLCYERGLGFVGRDIIWGNGAKNAKVMVVGKDSAGGDPDERLWRGSRYTRIPMTNQKSGAKLRIMLTKAGIDPFSVFITNTVKCNVGYDERGLSYANLVKVCLKNLRRELATVRSRIVIALGTHAAQQVWRLWSSRSLLCHVDLDPTETLEGFLPFRGALQEVTQDYGPDYGVEVFALKHPSYVEGPREARYVANLRAIAAGLS